MSPSSQRWSSWLTATTAVGVVPLCVGLVVWGPANIVSLAIVITVLVGFFHLIHLADNPGTMTVGRVLLSTVRVSTGVTVLVVALALAAALSAAVAVLALVTVVLTTPPVRDVLRRVTGRSVREHRGAAPTRTGLEHLSDQDLCAAWCHTTTQLSAQQDPARRLSLVVTRQHLLDEVWRRDREALSSWVAHGARHGEGRRRYFDQ